MTPLVWAILLLIVALALIFIEVFIPSGGLIGVLAALATVGAIVLAFMSGWKAGVVMLLCTMATVPIVVVAAIKTLPHTPMGKRVLLGPEDAGQTQSSGEGPRKLQDWIGRVGVAKTKMLPSGAVVIDGETVDAVSEGMAIEPGQTVRVADVRGNRIVVRIDEKATVEITKPTVNAATGDPLEQPAELLGLESLDDPVV